MKLLVALAILIASASAAASDFCNRQPVDPELPAGFSGNYQVIGKDPRTGKTYAGTLAIRDEKRAYSLIRVVNSQISRGEAWFERCGMDKIEFLMGQYHNPSGPIDFSCRLGADGDNYYRATCKTSVSQTNNDGLEAWFQNP